MEMHHPAARDGAFRVSERKSTAKDEIAAMRAAEFVLFAKTDPESAVAIPPSGAFSNKKSADD